MNYKYCLLVFFISAIICTPPPIPKPAYEIVTLESPVQGGNTIDSKNYKRLSDSKQFVANNKVIVEISDNGVTEEHELKITTENLANGYTYKYYGQTINVADGKALTLISKECKKYNNTDEESTINNECISNLKIDGNKYKFEFNYTLYNDEYILVKFKFTITQTTREILYRQESISISGIYPDGTCDYQFIIPEAYKNLGLQNNILTKESEYKYIYNNHCPDEQITDVIRLAPKEGYWKGEMTFYVKSDTAFIGDLTLKFPRLYRGGKNKNKNYELKTDENTVLKESNFIEDQIMLNVNLPASGKLQPGIKLHTAFSNKLEEEFTFYPTEELLDLEQDIDNTIKAKAQEIINDPNSEYKDYPDYYKIGKFVKNHITYDLSYHGADKTAKQIYDEQKGVCEHYTILYNAMLNSIGIKTKKIFGWAFDKETTSGDENTIGHAWTLAVINNDGVSKYMELDATWGLFEGIPAGHILKGFDKETYSFLAYGGTNSQILRTHKIELVENLDDEVEDSTIYNKEILNQKIEEVDETPNETKNSENEGEETPNETKNNENEGEENLGESKSSKNEGEENLGESKSSKNEGEENLGESKSINNEGEENSGESKSNEKGEEDIKNESIVSTTNITADEPEDGAKNKNISNLIYIMYLLLLML